MVVRPGRKHQAERRSSFVYTPRTREQVKARAEQTGNRFDSFLKQNIDMFRAKVGDNLFRILPPTWDGHEHYGYDIWVHSYVGADKSTYLCPAKMLKKPCAICAAEKEARSAGETEEAKELQATQRVLAWVLDRDDDNPHPIIFSMSWSMDRDIAALCQNERTGSVLQIDDPDNGYDVSLKRVGQGMKTRYIGLQIDRDPCPVHDDQREQDAILDFIQENPIPSVLNFYDNDYLKKVIEGTAGIDEVDEEDQPRRRPSARPKDEEEEEVVDEERPARRASRPPRDEEEEQEETPRRRPSRPARDEEVEEDEERPARPARSRAATDDDDERPARPARRPRDDEEPDDEPVDNRRSARRPSRPARDEDPETEEDEERAPSRGSGRTRGAERTENASRSRSATARPVRGGRDDDEDPEPEGEDPDNYEEEVDPEEEERPTRKPVPRHRPAKR